MTQLADLIETHFENDAILAWNQTHPQTWLDRLLRRKPPEPKLLPEAHIHWMEVGGRRSYPTCKFCGVPTPHILGQWKGREYTYDTPCRECYARGCA